MEEEETEQDQEMEAEQEEEEQEIDQVLYNSCATFLYVWLCAVLKLRIRDPVPFWPRDPAWVKIIKSGSGSGNNNPDHISEQLRNKFWD